MKGSSRRFEVHDNASLEVYVFALLDANFQKKPVHEKDIPASTLGAIEAQLTSDSVPLTDPDDPAFGAQVTVDSKFEWQASEVARLLAL